jgi:hypothetical protein
MFPSATRQKEDIAIGAVGDPKKFERAMVRQHGIRPESRGDEEAVRGELLGVHPRRHGGVHASLDEAKIPAAEVILDEGLGC